MVFGHAVLPPVSIAAAPNGAAVAVWERQSREQNNEIWAARFDGNRWRPPIRIGREDLGDQHRPIVAVDDRGDALIVWSSLEAGLWWPWTAGLRGETVSRAERLDLEPSVPFRRPFPSGVELAPTVAMDARGNGVATWIRSPAGQQTTRPDGYLAAARFNRESGWSAPVLLGPPEAVSPNVALGADGEAWILWSAGGIWFTSIAGDGSRWGSPVRLGDGSVPSLALEPSGGGGVAAWEHLGIVTRQRVAARWQDPDQLVTGVMVGPRVSINGGVAAAIWLDYPAKNTTVSHRSLQGGAWSPPLAIGSMNDDFPNVITTPAGGAVAAWMSPGETPFRLTARRFDGVTWSAPEVLAAREALVGRVAALVGLAIAPPNVLIAWTDVEPSGRVRVFTVQRPMN